MLRLIDYFEVTLKLSSKDLLSGSSQYGGHVAEILLRPIHAILNSLYGPLIIRLGHLGSVVI